jgi:hypothetical protein
MHLHLRGDAGVPRVNTYGEVLLLANGVTVYYQVGAKNGAGTDQGEVRSGQAHLRLWGAGGAAKTFGQWRMERVLGRRRHHYGHQRKQPRPPIRHLEKD